MITVRFLEKGKEIFFQHETEYPPQVGDMVVIKGIYYMVKTRAFIYKTSGIYHMITVIVEEV